MKVIDQWSAKIDSLNFFMDFMLEKLLRRKISTMDVTSVEDFYIKTKDYIGNQIIAHDLYEKRELKSLVHFLTPIHPLLKTGLGFDVGANIGNHTIFLAPYLQEVHAFEPNPRICLLLELNTQKILNIKIFNFGLSNSKASKTLYVDSQNVGGSSTIKNRGKFNDEIKIRLLPLDSIKIQYEKLQIIKIDVEGNEYEVLLGGIKTIQNSMPIILLEQFPSDFDSPKRSSIALLTKFGYRFVWMAHDSVNQNKIQRRIRRVVNLLYRREVTFFVTSSEVPRAHYPMLVAVPPRFFGLLKVGISA
jgi:FkbM family methyltransferase